MNEPSFSQARELIDNNEAIGIVVGKNPNTDAMGAALALYLSLQASGKKVFIASATQPIVELSNLVGIDKVKDSFEGEGGDLIVSFPYKEGEIDKVSYTLEEGFLNIVVKPGELGLSFTEQDVIYRRKGQYPGLIFTVGVPRISDLSSVFDISALKDTQIINIDNGAENQGYGDVVIIDLNSSSVSEQVTKLIVSLGFEIDLDVAQNLFSGIAQGTSNFQDISTSPQAFEMAGMLMNKGAIRQRVERMEKTIQSQEENLFEPQNPGEVLQQLSQIQGYRGQQQKRFENKGTRLQSPRGASSGGQGNFPQKVQQNQLRPQKQEQPQSQEQTQNPDLPVGRQDLKNPPEEWLTPKVYKGSTNV